MKKLFSFAAIVLASTVFISSTNAQKPPTKEELLKQIATLSNTKKPEDSAKAYELGKEYLVRFSKEPDANTPKIKVYVDKYRENQFFVHIDAKKYAEAFTIGKEILAEYPEKIEVLTNLAYAGYAASGSPAGDVYVNDAIAYSRKSIQLLDAGKTAASFAPFLDKNESVAYMYFIDGSLTIESEPAAAAGKIYRSTQMESQIKNDPVAYYLVAMYYENVYAKLAAEAKKDPARINAAIDLMMDAYARTCKRAEAMKHPNYATWKARLDQVYKFRKGSDAGFAEYMTQTNAAPLADPTKF